MKIVPIIPDYLVQLKNKAQKSVSPCQNATLHDQNNSYSSYIIFEKSLNATFGRFVRQDLLDENDEIGFLFSSKALVQLTVNPFVGSLINK